MSILFKSILQYIWRRKIAALIMLVVIVLCIKVHSILFALALMQGDHLVVAFRDRQAELEPGAKLVVYRYLEFDRQAEKQVVKLLWRRSKGRFMMEGSYIDPLKVYVVGSNGKIRSQVNFGGFDSDPDGSGHAEYIAAFKAGKVVNSLKVPFVPFTIRRTLK